MTRTTADVVIVGGGFAGASTAFHLARERQLRVVLWEAEPEAGRHSSGRNASLVRGASGGAEDELAREGVAFLRNPPDDFPAALSYRETGSYYIGRPDVIAERLVAGTTRTDVAVVERTVPFYKAPLDAVAAWTPSDGVVDIAALLRGYLDGARRGGVDVRFGAPVRRFLRAGDAVTGVEGADGHVVEADAVVVASGAWAANHAQMVGSSVRFRPTRRHVATLVGDGVDLRWPYVWDLERGVYFRPTKGGLLVCACDETDDVAGTCGVDATYEATLRARIGACLPDWASRPRMRFWAGHRTFVQGRATSLVGADPAVPGLYWAAGLGGHGMSTSAAVGRRVAAAITGRTLRSTTA